mmetsp:Transcript_7694/g.14519  ORF Transcript_7694/g.14519 Transcript_7694/m.14519 type:complete len:89 (-) Transcript_7694:17-283(-)
MPPPINTEPAGTSCGACRTRPNRLELTDNDDDNDEDDDDGGDDDDNSDDAAPLHALLQNGLSFCPRASCSIPQFAHFIEFSCFHLVSG